MAQRINRTSNNKSWPHSKHQESTVTFTGQDVVKPARKNAKGMNKQPERNCCPSIRLSTFGWTKTDPWRLIWKDMVGTPPPRSGAATDANTGGLFVGSLG